MTDAAKEDDRNGEAGERPQTGDLVCRAVLLGARIDTQHIERSDLLAMHPLCLRAGAAGFVVLFRFGIAVLVGLSPIEEADLRASLSRFIRDPVGTPEVEELEITLEEGAETVIGDGVVRLNDLTPARLQIIADVLAKSLMLEHYEIRIAGLFDRMEPVAEALRQSGRRSPAVSVLLRQIGDVLLTQHLMVGRVEVVERPEALWDHPELERLHDRLVREYELEERDRALDRKLTLISDTAETLLNLVQNKRSLRVEWYIVILILFEIMLTLYEYFVRH